MRIHYLPPLPGSGQDGFRIIIDQGGAGEEAFYHDSDGDYLRVNRELRLQDEAHYVPNEVEGLDEVPDEDLLVNGKPVFAAQKGEHAAFAIHDDTAPAKKVKEDDAKEADQDDGEANAKGKGKAKAVKTSGAEVKPQSKKAPAASSSSSSAPLQASASGYHPRAPPLAHVQQQAQSAPLFEPGNNSGTSPGQPNTALALGLQLQPRRQQGRGKAKATSVPKKTAAPSASASSSASFSASPSASASTSASASPSTLALHRRQVASQGGGESEGSAQAQQLALDKSSLVVRLTIPKRSTNNTTTSSTTTTPTPTTTTKMPPKKKAAAASNDAVDAHSESGEKGVFKWTPELETKLNFLITVPRSVSKDEHESLAAKIAILSPRTTAPTAGAIRNRISILKKGHRATYEESGIPWPAGGGSGASEAGTPVGTPSKPKATPKKRSVKDIEGEDAGSAKKKKTNKKGRVDGEDDADGLVTIKEEETEEVLDEEA